MCPRCGHRLIFSIYVICSSCGVAWQQYEYESEVYQARLRGLLEPTQEDE